MPPLVICQFNRHRFAGDVTDGVEAGGVYQSMYVPTEIRVGLVYLF